MELTFTAVEEILQNKGNCLRYYYIICYIIIKFHCDAHIVSRREQDSQNRKRPHKHSTKW